MGPVWVVKSADHNVSTIHRDLFHLLVAAIKIIPYEIRACIFYPNALLLEKAKNVNITQSGNSYVVAYKECKLTNCLSSAELKDLNVLLIVRHPSFVMFPVDLGNVP